MTSAGRPLLAGVRVLDFGRIIAAPAVGQILADLGAEVIKIERPGAGDETRKYGGGAPGMSSLFGILNRNKRSLALDFSAAGARPVLRRLLGWADVLVHNFKPGVMARQGLSPEAVWEINRNVVYCGISGFGSSGPMSGRPANDVIAQAFAGLMSFTGDAAGPPVRVPVPIADYTAGLYATIGILAALNERQRTQRGSVVETSLIEAMIALEGMHIGDYLASGVLPRRIASGNLLGQPNQAFHTRDGLVVIAAVNDQMWRRCAMALSGEALANDPRYLTGADRLARKDELGSLVEALTRQMSTEECMARLEAAEVVCGVVNDLAQVVRHPQVRHLGILRKHGDASDSLELVASPLTIDGVRPPVRRVAPEVGEDTVPVLESLGFTTAEISDLREQGVVGPLAPAQ